MRAFQRLGPSTQVRDGREPEPRDGDIEVDAKGGTRTAIPGLDKASARGRIDVLSAAVIAAGLAEPGIRPAI